MQSIPNPKNFCGGNFQDWLEVNLIEKCNAKCSWCIECGGFHPEYHATTQEMIDVILKTEKTNIILLGGEPLLYKEIETLIDKLFNSDRNVYVTTNGLLLTKEFVREKLWGLVGINISIHDFDLIQNQSITGIKLNEKILIEAIEQSEHLGIDIRLNCNLIKGHIDSYGEILEYVRWAKRIGADKIRFAELKDDENNFIDASKIIPGLNNDPFKEGCWTDLIIEEMPVNFRQMCGLQTKCRPKPINPKRFAKDVVYYDGKVYHGWQKEKDMDSRQKNREYLLAKIEKMFGKNMTQEQRDEFMKSMEKFQEEELHRYHGEEGCVY